MRKWQRRCTASELSDGNAERSATNCSTHDLQPYISLLPCLYISFSIAPVHVLRRWGLILRFLSLVNKVFWAECLFSLKDSLAKLESYLKESKLRDEPRHIKQGLRLAAL